VNRKPISLLALLLILQGCAVYHPKPLDEQKVSESLASPDLRAIRVKAQEIKHPILKPRTIDFTNGISAEDAALIAVITNPAIRAERDRMGIAGAQLLQAGILPNPKFSYNLAFPTGGSDQGTVNAYGLGLDWDIIKPLLTRGAEIDAARANEASVYLDIAWKEWQVAQSAKLGVYRVIMFEKQLGIAQKEENDLKDNLQAVSKAVDEGNMTIVDLDAVEALLRKTHATVLDIGQKLKAEKLALNSVLGFPPSENIPLKTDIAFPELKTLPLLQAIMDGLENRRLDLLALRRGYQSQEASLRSAVRAQFPAISIGFSHARDTTDVITTGFAVSIDLPFFDRNQGRIAIERATRQQLYDEYMNRVFEARANAAAILANIKSVEAQIEAANKSVRALERLVHISYSGFLEGNIDVLSYYNEVDRLISGRLDALKLEQDLSGLYVALEITAGEYIGNGGKLGGI
jgi:outer membrane protein TolC